jgi:hypothetical protein
VQTILGGLVSHKKVKQLFVAAVVTISAAACNSEEPGRRDRTPHAMRGGSATVRVPYEPAADDPATTNDESNDQPLGHLGTVSIHVYYPSSGNRYPLDADMEGDSLLRLYFHKAVGLTLMIANWTILRVSAKTRMGGDGYLKAKRSLISEN